MVFFKLKRKKNHLTLSARFQTNQVAAQDVKVIAGADEFFTFNCYLEVYEDSS